MGEVPLYLLPAGVGVESLLFATLQPSCPTVYFFCTTVRLDPAYNELRELGM